MTWTIVKLFFKKTWLWTKEHWQVPFLVAWTVLVYILTRRNSDSAFEVLNARKESYKKQLEVLRKKHNDELLKREKLIEKYEETLQSLEEDYKVKQEELSETHKNDIKEVVVKSKGDPDVIREMIEREFGIDYTE